MPARDDTKCSMLMERLCLMHISWPLGRFYLWCHFLWILFVYLCPFLSLCSILLVVGFREQLWKAHISPVKYAEKQSKQTWWGIFTREFRSRMSKAETLPPAKMAGSEMFHSRSVLHVFTNTDAGSQDVERRNTELEGQIQSAEKTLASSQEEQAQAEVEVRRVIEVLDVKICDLSDLRQSLAKLIAD